ncbi:MAG: lysophospholipid acyltransferase family protein [Planctomycetota bacterium]
MSVVHRIQATGLEHLPGKPPYILVANHTSHLDTPALLSVLPRPIRRRTYPLAAHDTFFTTHARALLATKLLNVLPLRRQHADRNAIATLRQRIVEDELVLIVFPEGTRGDGSAIKPFRAGIGMLVAGTDVPVVPCRLRGCEQALPKGKLLPKPTPLSLAIGKPDQFSDSTMDKEGWLSIAMALYAAVDEL